MKFFTAFFMAVCLCGMVKTNAQTVSINETGSSLESVFAKIKKQTDYTFVYTNELLKKAAPVTVKVDKATLEDALKLIFAGQPPNYTIYNKIIVVKDKDVHADVIIRDDYTIHGTVSDEKGEALPGAVVYITNSKYIMATDNEGAFGFNNIQPGTYEVAIKMLGFDPLIQTVNVKQKSIKLVAHLTESITELNTVTVTGKSLITPAARERYTDMFIKYFIGETVNAQQCKLLNPEALQFHIDRENYTLHANSDQFLIVENKALGYKLKYLLTDFEINLKNSTCITGGSPYFEEMPGTDAQKKKWDDNRRAAYLSSSRHFFRAVMNNTAKAEGYTVSVFFDKPDYKDKPQKIDSLFFAYNNDLKAYRSDIAIINNRRDTVKQPKRLSLFVSYNGVKASPLFFKTGMPLKDKIAATVRNPQESEIQLLSDTLFIDHNGNIAPSKKVIFSGYWGWERIADLTPLDYFVEPEINHKELENTAKQPVLKDIISAIDTIRNRLPVEKIYLQTDKPYYSGEDTLHFKAYLLDADFMRPSQRSGLLYVELDNADNKMVKRIMSPLASGVTWGDIALDEKEIPPGSYTLRAYTNWMRNFGEDYVFKKNIYITLASSSSTLITAAFKADTASGKNNIQANLYFADLDKDALRMKEMQLRVMNGKRTLLKDNATTGIDGKMAVNFNLPDKTQLKNLTIRARQTAKNGDTTNLIIPVQLNRVGNIDLQFMPEGGNMVAGISSRIGFKAIGENGKATDVTGKIYNSKQQEIATIRSSHKGMGSFELTPQAGESYTAKIIYADKTIKSYPLPAVNAAGTTLKVVDDGLDSLQIITASTNTPATYYLIGQARGVVCYAVHLTLTAGRLVNRVSKDVLPTGVVRFTLLNNAEQALNERAVYINHEDNLQINITQNKQDYATRDSVALVLQVNDKDGKPVEGTFSLAVTDDSQVRTDSLGSNLVNNLLFTADVKGTVEEPGWYLQKNDKEHLLALDNLLLTQGWVGYDWKQVFNTKSIVPEYVAEKDFEIKGKLSGVFTKSVKNAVVVLYLKGLKTSADEMISDKDGGFYFKNVFPNIFKKFPNVPPTDSAQFKLMALRIDKGAHAGIQIDNEFKPPVFTPNSINPTPWYVNSDTVLLNNTSTKLAQQKAYANYKGEGHMLKEVVIKEKKIIPDSKNLNGPGESDQTLDEKELEKAGKMSLEELLIKKIKGYKERGEWAISEFPLKIVPTSYMINEKLVYFVFDGVVLNRLYDGKKRGPVQDPERYNFLKGVLDNYTAEDIKGVEIMYNNNYMSNYLFRYIGAAGKIPPIAFIEITTRSGSGPYLKPAPWTYIYKPVPYTLPKQFYRPRYTPKNQNIAMGTDLRSTIHWEPNVVTDSLGRATVSFFSADKPSNYTLIVEGTDLNGNIGYKRQKIKAASTTIAAAK